MANQSGKWETVVKKKGPVTKSDVKKAQQKFYDSATHHQFDEVLKNPLQETKTIFESFGGEKGKAQPNPGGLDKENEPQEKHPSFLHATYSSPGKVNPGKGQTVVKGTHIKKKGSKAPKPDPLQDCITMLNKLNSVELDLFIANLKEKFPSHPTVWLRDVASWFQMQINGAVEKDLALRDQEKDFPSKQMPQGVIKSLQDLVNSCSASCLSGVLVFCASSMLTEAQHGKSTIGYRAFCQVLLNEKPLLLKDRLSEVLNGRSKTAESYQILMWIFSQTFEDLGSCLEVWWKAMYPVLHVRHHSALAVKYLETALRTHTGQLKEKPMLSKDEYMQLVSACLSAKSPLAHTPSAKSTLARLLPEIRQLYFTDDVGKYAAKLFESLLKELSTDEEAIRQELLEHLVKCLQSDPATFDKWKEMFRANLVVSSLLLSYIEDKKASIQEQLNSGYVFKSKIVLEDVFRDFLVILLEMHRKGEGSKPGLSECYHVCLRNVKGGRKQSRKRFFVYKMLKYSSLIALLCLSLDLWANRGWEGSKSQKLAVYTGGDVMAERVFNFTRDTGAKSQSWLAKNVPYYYSNVHPHVKVIMDTTRVYIVNASVYLYQKSEPARNYFNEYMPVIFEKVDDLVARCWHVISTQSVRMWGTAYPYVKEGLDYGSYFIFSVLPGLKENLVRGYWNVVESVYGINPGGFDNIAIVLSTYWEKLVSFIPGLLDKIQEIFLTVFRSLSGCLQQGQNWIHSNILSFNTSPPSGS